MLEELQTFTPKEETFPETIAQFLESFTQRFNHYPGLLTFVPHSHSGNLTKVSKPAPPSYNTPPHPAALQFVALANGPSTKHEYALVPASIKIPPSHDAALSWLRRTTNLTRWWLEEFAPE